MTKQDALDLIKDHKNNRSMIDPVQMLNWTWMFVIIGQIPEEEWDKYVRTALPTLSK